VSKQQPRTGALRRTRRLAVNAACVLVALGALAFLAPAAFGMQRYVIAGESMTGTYDLGSVVFEDVVPVADLRVGDVITYMPPADAGIDHLVTHRIVSIKGDQLRTQGDANPDPDPWTFRLTAATQPRVRVGVPYVGFVLLGLQDRTVRLLAIGVPATLIALLSLAELAGLRRRRPDTAESAGAVRVPAQRTSADAQVEAEVLEGVAR
jgi:signal peptidase